MIYYYFINYRIILYIMVQITLDFVAQLTHNQKWSNGLLIVKYFSFIALNGTYIHSGGFTVYLGLWLSNVPILSSIKCRLMHIKKLNALCMFKRVLLFLFVVYLFSSSGWRRWHRHKHLFI